MNESTRMELMRQLGYEKRNTGRWIEEIEDEGSGFPKVVGYICPFCEHTTDTATRFCPYCGSRLEDE